MDLYEWEDQWVEYKWTYDSILTIRDYVNWNQEASLSTSIDLIKIWDENLDSIMDESWCSPSNNIKSVKPGSAESDLCTSWDDEYMSIDFTPITATGNNGVCKDDAPTWIYGIDNDGISPASNDLQVSIDSLTNKIWVKGLSSGSAV